MGFGEIMARLGSFASKAQVIEAGLDFIKEESDDIFRKIAEVHGRSARQSLETAKRSNAKDQEIRVAIGHFRDTYNFLERDNEQMFSILRRGDNIRAMMEIASIISIHYRCIGDLAGAREWAERAYFRTYKIFQREDYCDYATFDALTKVLRLNFKCWGCYHTIGKGYCKSCKKSINIPAALYSKSCPNCWQEISVYYCPSDHTSSFTGLELRPG